MSDDLKNVGKPDRDRVSAHEPYEVDRLARKHDLPAPLVEKVIASEGPMRRDIEESLARIKENGRR